MRLALLLVLALAVPAAALSAVEGAPNPCALVPATTVSKVMGAAAKPMLERANNGVRVCSYWAAATNGQLQIEAGSRSEFVKASPAGQPPGTVVKSEPGLGENGEFSYNTQKRYHFADAAFERGPYYFAVFSQAVRPAGVLALAKVVHQKVAG